jgi:hypothetical protein
MKKLLSDGWLEFAASVGTRVKRLGPDGWLLVAGVAVVVLLVGGPFTVVRYPPMTDLPFHAASISVFRHYFDPAWHFREQFVVRPFDSPYLATYGLGALLALVLPIVTATKCTAAAMIALLPIGLGVLFWGMKKSPLWGLLGLGLAWGSLTHWGFMNFVGAIGLFAMAIGFTLLVVDRPTRARQIGLGVALVAVFVTHVFRFPFAVAGALAAAALMYPATRRIRPVLLPIAAACLVFAAWRLLSRAPLAADLGPLAIHAERLSEIPESLFGTFAGSEEWRLARQMGVAYAAVLAASTALFFAQGRHRGRRFREWWWGAMVTFLPLAAAAGFLLAYLVLPMRMGIWWYVYPREITAAAFIGLAVMPDLPRQWWLRLALLLVVVGASGRVALHTSWEWRDFERRTVGFREIVPQVPPAPKLMYLVFVSDPLYRLSSSPFVHLPAWVQAERGGWLSFHFASSGASPVAYRPESPEVPPPAGPRWEWDPQRFKVNRDGPWFDTFLVASASNPQGLFAADRSIRLVSHARDWWLFRRVR